jgi:hypothetical protein
MQRRSNLNGLVIIAACLLVMECTAAGQKIVYVDGDAPGANDGTNWIDAYNFLQDALVDAEDSEKPVEVRVAQGIYKPDQDSYQRSGTGDQDATFGLINGVAVKGGFAGFGQPDPDARDIAAYETILTGDLKDNDVEVTDPCDALIGPTRIDNSYTVVTSVWTDATAVLEGFTISGGNANVAERTPTRRSSGGGMYNNSGNATVMNCTFINNSVGWYGGGMNNEGGAVTISNCTFHSNWSLRYGGGMSNRNNSKTSVSSCTFTRNSANRGGGMSSYNSNSTVTGCAFGDNCANEGGAGMYNSSLSNPTMSDCVFTGNFAFIGAGIYNRFDSNPTLTDCRFGYNSADWGGGMANLGSHPKLNKCTFSGNWGSGGGVCNWDSHPVLTNCMFRANASAYDGGGIYNSQSSPTLINCIFSRNFANSAGAIYCLGGRMMVSNCTFSGNLAGKGHALACGVEEQIYPSEIELANCILWDGSNEIWNNDGSVIAIEYCDIQGGQSQIHDPCNGVRWGAGNISADPQFAEPIYPESDGAAQNAGDDPDVEGDYHLKSQAGRWDPQSQKWVRDDVTSPCIDAGDPADDVGDEPNPNGVRINMGGYGGTAEASKSLLLFYAGLVDCRGHIVTQDEVERWVSLGQPECWCYPCHCRMDANGDCIIDFTDLLALQGAWPGLGGSYDPCCDTNYDGVLNAADVLAIRFVWPNLGGPGCSGCPPCP